MKIIHNIANRFDCVSTDSNLELPYSILVLDDFLPKDLALAMSNECDMIPTQYWKQFTRNGSQMDECTNLEQTVHAYDFTNQIHSLTGMNWLTKITGIDGLIPDPYITGAGYSKISNGNSLKVHVDFNWNDHLKLHRALSLIVYLTPKWQDSYGGSLDFYDINKTRIVKSIPTAFNRAVIWQYHKRGFHGSAPVVNSTEKLTRKSFKLFFYTSNSTYLEDDLPHRSLYWYDENDQTPYDIRTHK